MLGSILFLQISQVTGRALFFVFSLWYLNRYLGVEAKGVWTGLFSLFGILAVFSNMGFEVWLSRAVARSEITAASALGYLFRTKSGPWLICIVVGAFKVVEYGYPVAVALPFALALILDGVGVAEQAVYEGGRRTRSMAWMSFLKSGGFALAALAAGFLAPVPGLPLFAWIFALTLLLRTLLGWRCWRLLPRHVPALSPRVWREFLLFGAYTFVTVLYFQIDAVMLYAMAGKRVTGDYGNAYNLVEGALFISAAVGAILYPRLVTAPEEVRGRMFDVMCRLVLVVAAVGVAGLWLLGPWFGTLVAGDAFAGAVPPLLMLAVGLPFMFANGLLSRWLFATGRERFALVTAASLAVFNIIGNRLLIPLYGAGGAAVMTLATEGGLFLIWLLWGRRARALLFFWAGLAVILAAIGLLHFRLGLSLPAALLAAIVFGPLLWIQGKRAHLFQHETPSL